MERSMIHLCEVSNRKEIVMILMRNGVSGQNMAALLTFIYGDENLVTIYRDGWGTAVGGMDRIRVVCIKEIHISSDEYDPRFRLTLDILEQLRKRDERDMSRVDPKYLLKVHEILNREPMVDQLTDCVSTEKPQVQASDEKYPPISLGTKVRTNRPTNRGFREEWTDGRSADKRWGVKGTVIARRDGLFYDVCHEDGTLACYDPSELEVVQ